MFILICCYQLIENNNSMYIYIYIYIYKYIYIYIYIYIYVYCDKIFLFEKEAMVYFSMYSFASIPLETKAQSICFSFLNLCCRTIIY